METSASTLVLLLATTNYSDKTSSENVSSNSNSSSGGHRFEAYSLAHLVSTVTVLSVIIVSAIVGNVFVISAVFLEKNLRSVANLLIVSLATVDLLVATLDMPLAVVNEVSQKWFLGQILCDFWTSIDVLCCTCSIMHLVAIAIDRYWAVTRVDYIHNRSRRSILLMIATSWTISILICIPPLFFHKIPQHDTRITGECLINQSPMYQVFSTLGAFYLPFTIMMIIYFKIFLTARARIRKKHFQNQKHAKPKNTKNTGCCCFFKAANSTNMNRSLTTESSNICKMTGNTGVNERASTQIIDNTSTSDPDKYNPNIAITGQTKNILSKTSKTNEEIQFDQVNIKTPLCLIRIDESEQSRSPIDQSEAIASKTGESEQSRSPIDQSETIALNTGESEATRPLVRSNLSDTLNIQRTESTISFNSTSSGSPNKTLLTPDKIPGNKETASPNEATRFATKRQKMDKKRERKAARTLAIITGTFILCWLPFFIVALIRPFCEACFFPAWLLGAINWLGFMNSLLNPVIYTVFNLDFRNAFKKILFGKYSKFKLRRNNK